MLSVATADHLVLVDPSSLKRPPPSLPPTCTIPAPSTASAWSPDSASLYVASAHSITRYDSSGALIKTVYESAESGERAKIACVVVKDKGTLLFGMGASVHTLEHSASPSSASKIVHTLPPHPDPSSSPLRVLSLSNDGTLLAAASARAVLVHNLSLGAHTVLKNLPTPESEDTGVCACVFHPHSRVRLFLGIGRSLVVYDITRPSGPSRVIPMSETAGGRVVGIACSPYSKTLLAVACSEGYVAMVDLDKEKGRIRSFDYNVELTSLAFSMDGATLYMGTVTGQLLVQTLRAVEPPKTVELGPGARVECMAIAKKTKLSLDSPTKTIGGFASKPLTPHDTNTPRRSLNGPLSPTPPKDISGKQSASSGDNAATDGTVRPKARTPPTGITPIRKRVSSTTAIGSRKATAARSLLAGAREDHDIAKTDLLSPEVHKGKKDDPDDTAVPVFPTKPPSRVASTRTKPSTAQGIGASAPTTKASIVTPRVRTISHTIRHAAALKLPSNSTSTPQATPRTRTISTPKSPLGLSSKSPAATRAPSPSATPARGHVRTRTVSTASRTTTGASALSVSRATSRTSITTVSSGKFTSSALSSTTGTARERSPVPPVPRLPRTQAGGNLRSSERARTPSPELRMRSPVMDEPPPFPVKGTRKGLSVLGLGTPEVERWIEGGHWKGKGKEGEKGADEARRFGFARDEEEDGRAVLAGARVEDADEDTGEALKARTCERPLSMQVTPRRSTGAGWAPSPLRNSVAAGSPGAGGVQTMLHALIKDAMLDFQQETKAEMVGLHLDLVRMGRAWRQEMRSTMEEYVGDLRELREENMKLRDENERLRRGY